MHLFWCILKYCLLPLHSLHIYKELVEYALFGFFFFVFFFFCWIHLQHMACLICFFIYLFSILYILVSRLRFKLEQVYSSVIKKNVPLFWNWERVLLEGYRCILSKIKYMYQQLPCKCVTEHIFFSLNHAKQWLILKFYVKSCMTIIQTETAKDSFTAIKIVF